jgi:hypothetical protein
VQVLDEVQALGPGVGRSGGHVWRGYFTRESAGIGARVGYSYVKSRGSVLLREMKSVPLPGGRVCREEGRFLPLISPGGATTPSPDRKLDQVRGG